MSFITLELKRLEACGGTGALRCTGGTREQVKDVCSQCSLSSDASRHMCAPFAGMAITLHPSLTSFSPKLVFYKRKPRVVYLPRHLRTTSRGMQLQPCQLHPLFETLEYLLHRVYFSEARVLEQTESRYAEVRVEHVDHVARPVGQAS
jgi:hypothetical protein